MEPSEEIRRVVERWMVAQTEGDADAFLGRLSDHPGTLMIGSDAEEWFHAAERAVLKRQLEETGAMPATWTRSRPGRREPSGGQV
jgi:hypothetical protein